MPLSATVLAASVKAKLLANDDSKAVDNAALDALCQAVSEAVVEHLTTAAVVVIAPPGGGAGVIT